MRRRNVHERLVQRLTVPEAEVTAVCSWDGALDGLHHRTDAGDDDVLTVDEAARMLKVGRNALYEACGRNEIPHRRVGRLIRFSRAALVTWLDSWSKQGAQEGQ